MAQAINCDELDSKLVSQLAKLTGKSVKHLRRGRRRRRRRGFADNIEAMLQALGDGGGRCCWAVLLDDQIETIS